MLQLLPVLGLVSVKCYWQCKSYKQEKGFSEAQQKRLLMGSTLADSPWQLANLLS